MRNRKWNQRTRRQSVEQLEPRNLMAGDVSNDRLPVESDGHHIDHAHDAAVYYRPQSIYQSVSHSTSFAPLSDASDKPPVEVATDYIRANAADFGLQPSDVDRFRVSDLYTSEHNGVSHVYLRQQHHGLDVLHADINVNVMSDGSVLTVGSSFVTGLEEEDPYSPATRQRVGSDLPMLEPEQALVSLAKEFGWQLRRASRAPLGTQLTSTDTNSGLRSSLGATEDSYEYDTFPGGGELVELLPTSGVSLDPIPTQLRYVPRPDGSVELAWGLIVRTPDGQHWLDASVSAVDGELLYASDWVGHASYRVFALPLESPDDGAATFVSDVADDAASPLGWHDSDIRAGIGSSTVTRGNNVVAQEDANGDDQGGFSPNGGDALEFDFDVDFGVAPEQNDSAAITNLFYHINVAHDIHYAYGFDEAAGNFQEANFSNGGRDGDPVVADSRDRFEFDNAAFYPTPDGISPRIQMGEWSGNIQLDVVSPASVRGTYNAGGASFGPPLTPDSVDGEVVVSNPRDGCGPLLNASTISGNIALIERGTCYFTEKVTHAQNAGARGVIITNQEPVGLISMAGDEQTDIPALMITRDDGNLLRSVLDSGESVNVGLSGTLNLDSSFDNGVIQHEYGHGVSTRLSGGPSNASSLDSIQGGGLGEGWSDWWSLMLTQTAEDTQMEGRLLGTYLTTGQGIRRFPYSYDMAVNPLTFDDMDEESADVSCGGAECSEVHNTGEIWASALWDLNWLLINGDGGSIPAQGFDADLYQGTGGNNVALQLVMDGIKLAPANPSFLDARDAIISADIGLTGGENLLAIWTAFSRRGFGASASVFVDGLVDITVDEAFDIPDLAGNAVWFGDSNRGAVGDGVSWGDPNNWRTNGFSDRLPSMVPPGDDVTLETTPSRDGVIDLGGDQFVNSIRFQDDYRLTGGDLAISSGQIIVDFATVGTIDADVVSGVALDKSGAGTLVLGGAATEVNVSEGALLVRSTASIQDLSVQSGAVVILHGEVSNEVTGGGLVITAGDVNRDGAVTPADVDALFSMVGSGGYDPTFDLVADGIINRADLDNLIFDRIGTDYGDADLSGAVDSEDFNDWNANRFGLGTGWATGDFNGDGVTDVSDFNIWNENRFRVSASSEVQSEARGPRAAASVEALTAVPQISVRRRFADLAFRRDVQKTVRRLELDSLAGSLSSMDLDSSLRFAGASVVQFRKRK